MAGKTEEKVPDTIPVYNIHDGIGGRKNGGPWLDEEVAKQQEIINAHQEDREPDFDNLQGSASFVLVTAGELVKVHANSIPVDGGNVNIDAPVKGETLNPVKVDIEERKAAAEESQKRAEGKSEEDEFGLAETKNKEDDAAAKAQAAKDADTAKSTTAKSSTTSTAKK